MHGNYQCVDSSSFGIHHCRFIIIVDPGEKSVGRVEDELTSESSSLHPAAVCCARTKRGCRQRVFSRLSNAQEFTQAFSTIFVYHSGTKNERVFRKCTNPIRVSPEMRSGNISTSGRVSTWSWSATLSSTSFDSMWLLEVTMWLWLVFRRMELPSYEEATHEPRRATGQDPRSDTGSDAMKQPRANQIIGDPSVINDERAFGISNRASITLFNAVTLHVCLLRIMLDDGFVAAVNHPDSWTQVPWFETYVRHLIKGWTAGELLHAAWLNGLTPITLRHVVQVVPGFSFVDCATVRSNPEHVLMIVSPIARWHAFVFHWPNRTSIELFGKCPMPISMLDRFLMISCNASIDLSHQL